LAGRSLALARSCSSASVSGARQKVRVEVRKLHQYVWAGQRHPSRRPGSPRCGTVASRRHQQQEGAQLPNQPGARPGVARAGGRGGGVGRGCRAGRARRRNRSEHSPGRCRASRAPIRSPPGSGSSLMCSVPAAVVVSTVMSRTEVALAGRGQVTRRASSRVHRERLRYQLHRRTNPCSRMTPRLSRQGPKPIVGNTVREGAGSRWPCIERISTGRGAAGHQLRVAFDL
jgi:hypothetical protein